MHFNIIPLHTPSYGFPDCLFLSSFLLISDLPMSAPLKNKSNSNHSSIINNKNYNKNVSDIINDAMNDSYYALSNDITIN